MSLEKLVMSAQGVVMSACLASDGDQTEERVEIVL
jgi:hypothetical protein